MTGGFRTAALAALVLMLLAAGPASAGDATPFATPQCDVDILYAVPVPDPAGAGLAGAPAGAARAVTQRLRVQAASGRQRLDPPSSGAFMLTDGRTGQTVVVEPSLRLATVLPSSGAPTPPPGVRAAGDYAGLDETTVAGNACRNWRTRDLAGHQSVVCLTGDGLLLRLVQDGQVRAEAIRVERAPQPDALFAVPAGDRLVRAPIPPPPQDGPRHG